MLFFARSFCLPIKCLFVAQKFRRSTGVSLLLCCSSVLLSSQRPPEKGWCRDLFAKKLYSFERMVNVRHDRELKSLKVVLCQTSDCFFFHFNLELQMFE